MLKIPLIGLGWNWREHALLARYVMRWIGLGVPLGLAVGSVCALFLLALDWATVTRMEHPRLLWLLPLAGVGMVAVYRSFGASSEAGNDLLIESIQGEGAGVPRRMAPLIFVATVVTHLFGGSAGREGTAVQMGGSLAAGYARLLRLAPDEVRVLLMCGIAAGFAGVFGTPFAGAVFAMEVLVIGRLSYGGIIPCVIAAVVSNWTCAAWGVHHTHYGISALDVALRGDEAGFHWVLGAKVVVAAAAFGMASVLFASLTHRLHQLFGKIGNPLLRPVAGAFCIIGLTWLLGTRDYLGLGDIAAGPNGVTIASCFKVGGASSLSWWWKLLFTALTLSCGFKGGEVTPLFFMGAALGNSVARVLHAPIDLFAGLGFVAVFAGATNTPLACTIMGMELFGTQYTIYFLIACFISYGLSGHSGIYGAQRIGGGKPTGAAVDPDLTLAGLRGL